MQRYRAKKRSDATNQPDGDVDTDEAGGHQRYSDQPKDDAKHKKMNQPSEE